jgi:hypothetical protein
MLQSYLVVFRRPLSVVHQSLAAESLNDLLRSLSDLGVDVTELVIPATAPGKPQDIVLRNHRFRGSVLSEVLVESESH